MDLDSKARPERGLDNFVALLRKLKDRNPRLFEMRETFRPSPQSPRNQLDIREAFGDPEEAARFIRRLNDDN